MKVAYVFPPAWDPRCPSYTTALFAGSTKQQHHEFHGFDLNADFFNAVSTEDKQLWDGRNSFKWRTEWERLSREYADFLEAYLAKMIAVDMSLYAIYVQGISNHVSLWLAEQIKSKSPNSGLILGGPHCFPAYAGLTLLENESVDAICTGEGDRVWPMVLDVFSRTGTLHVDVPGIAYKTSDGTIHGGEVPELVKDLDSIPFADYSSFDLSAYGDKIQLSTMTSRGCVNTCAFCNEKPNFYRYRFRSAQNIFDELAIHLRKTKLSYVAFNDSLINGNPKELARFCDIVIKKRLKFRWGGMALLRKEMTPDLLKKMKKAGCFNVSWGLESGSSDVLRLMQKRLFDMDLAREVIRHTSDAGINQSCSLIVGFPGETEEMFQETIQFIKEYGAYFESIGVQPMMIVHNSTVYDQCEEFGIDPDNAQKYLEWKTKDGKLDYEKRLERVSILESVLGEQLILTEHE